MKTAEEMLKVSHQGAIDAQKAVDDKVEKTIQLCAASGHTNCLDPGVSEEKRRELEARGFRFETCGWIDTIEVGEGPPAQTLVACVVL